MPSRTRATAPLLPSKRALDPPLLQSFLQLVASGSQPGLTTGRLHDLSVKTNNSWDRLAPESVAQSLPRAAFI